MSTTNDIPTPHADDQRKYGDFFPSSERDRLERELAQATAKLEETGRALQTAHRLHKSADAELTSSQQRAERLDGIAEGVLTALAYPRGSEAQVRCLEEIGQDVRHLSTAPPPATVPVEAAKDCPHCLFPEDQCECCDADVDPDTGDQ